MYSASSGIAALVSLLSHPQWPFGEYEASLRLQKIYPDSVGPYNKSDSNGHCVWFADPVKCWTRDINSVARGAFMEARL